MTEDELHKFLARPFGRHTPPLRLAVCAEVLGEADHEHFGYLHRAMSPGGDDETSRGLHYLILLLECLLEVGERRFRFQADIFGPWSRGLAGEIIQYRILQRDDRPLVSRAMEQYGNEIRIELAKLHEALVGWPVDLAPIGRLRLLAAIMCFKDVLRTSSREAIIDWFTNHQYRYRFWGFSVEQIKGASAILEQLGLLLPPFGECAPALRLAVYDLTLRKSSDFQWIRPAFQPNASEDARLGLQYAVFLLERMLKIGEDRFYFRWDLYGPYSTQLGSAVASHRLRSEGSQDLIATAERRYGKTVCASLETLGGAIKGWRSKLPVVYRLDLVASLAYLAEAGSLSFNRQSAGKILREHGRNFHYKRVRLALDTLEYLGLP